MNPRERCPEGLKMDLDSIEGQGQKARRKEATNYPADSSLGQIQGEETAIGREARQAFDSTGVLSTAWDGPG